MSLKEKFKVILHCNRTPCKYTPDKWVAGLCEECQLDDLVAAATSEQDDRVCVVEIALQKNIREHIYKNVCELGIQVKNNKGGVIPIEEMTVEFLVKVLVDNIKSQRHNSSIDEALNCGDGTYKP